MNFVVALEDAGLRLDLFLKTHLKEFSRNQIQRWIDQKAVLCNEKLSFPSHPLKVGEIVSISIPEEEITTEPEPIPLEIIYEDDSLLAINKPAGMVTHPAIGHFKGTLANAVAHHLQRKLSKGLRAGIVHRLDKGTSGVLVVAKTISAMENLARQFRLQKVLKRYRAIVSGKIESQRGEIEGSIGKDFHFKKMAVTSTGRFSRTDFRVLKSFAHHTYLEVYPKTGRTHQIRVHLSKIGHPVLGDQLYGGEADGVSRQILHAYKITIQHPLSKKKMEFTAPLPKDFLQALKIVSKS